jgi:hypothetical protein
LNNTIEGCNQWGDIRFFIQVLSNKPQETYSVLKITFFVDEREKEIQ